MTATTAVDKPFLVLWHDGDFTTIVGPNIKVALANNKIGISKICGIYKFIEAGDIDRFIYVDGKWYLRSETR